MVQQLTKTHIGFASVIFSYSNLVEGCDKINDHTAHQENDCKRDTNAVVLMILMVMRMAMIVVVR